jgi:hypothetical protein
MTQQQQIARQAADTDGYFGLFWLEVGYPVGPDFDNLTLADAASMEFAALERILSRALWTAT